MTDAPERIWAAPHGAYYWSTEDLGSGLDTEYIRADLARPRVKPLVWDAFGSRAYVATAPLFGRLRIDPFGRDGTWTVCFSVPGYSATFLPGDWSSPDAAKAAAQADYERRILEALE